MTTIRSYTTIEQSRKLAEVLPLESADNYYSWHDERYYIVNKDCPYPYSLKEKIPCWSLAALLDIIGHYTLQTVSDSKRVIVVSENGNPVSSFSNPQPVDACYELILKLHELKKL